MSDDELQRRMWDLEHDLRSRQQDYDRVRAALLPLLPELAAQDVTAGGKLRAGYVAEEAAELIRELHRRLGINSDGDN